MKTIVRLLAMAALSLAATAHAQGIPVIDVANLIQTIQQVLNDVTKIENQVAQIRALQSQLESATGSRHLGAILNNAGLQNYVPAEVYNQVNAVDTDGYAGLTATAKALRDAGMLYNCVERALKDRAACQRALAQPYQQKGLLQDAMHAASGRLAQITALMARVDATTDPKGVLEIQARIGAENALLAHELSQIQMLQAMADSDERISRARERERQYEMLGRTGRIADHLP